jgi:surfeit locus 1 family protein
MSAGLTNLVRELRFEPRLATSLAAAAGVALALALAWWQLGRAHEKERLAAALQARAEAPPLVLGPREVSAEEARWRRVIARGRFDPRYAVFVDNKVYRGVAGYHVVMPLAIEGGPRHVLVYRGWVAGGPERGALPAIETPQGEVEVAGLAFVPSERFLELAAHTAEGRIWQNLTIERFRQAAPLELQPFALLQQNDIADGLVRDWERPDAGVQRHYGYAFQWLALAVTIAAIYLLTHVRRRPR